MVNGAPDEELQSFLNIGSRLVTIIKAILPKMRLTSHIKLPKFMLVDYRLREITMRRSSAIIVIALGAAVAASEADAKLDLFVDKSTQQISVIQNGRLLYVWPVSTGRDKFSTPSGVYAPERLEPMWFSKAYYNSPMPHAIFFHNGYAIHGSYDIARLGGPASHGCVRLHPQDAAMLYAMVQQEGPGNTTIVVGGGGSLNPVPPPRDRDFDEPSRPPDGRDGAIARGAYPPGPPMPPYYNDPTGPQAPPYYSADPYVDGPGRRRGDSGQLAARAPYPANRPPAPHLDAQASIDPTLGPRGSYRPPGPQAPPYYGADPYVDATGRRRGDNRPLATRAPYPTNRPPAPRLDAQASIDPTLGLRGSYRPPATAKSNSKCANCSPNRASDESPTRHISASETAPSPPPAPPPPVLSPPASSPSPSATTASSPPEQQQSDSGYKVLPKSYWAGAAWRWRLKAEHDITGFQSPAPGSP
jgi:L,D-transpeptidase catalytic domain